MTTVKVFYPTRILSSANASDLIDWIQHNIGMGDNTLLINLQNVLFMDSSGLATLVTARKLLTHANGQLAICSLNGQARMLFEMAGLEKMFEIYDNAKEFEMAIASQPSATC